MANPQVHHPVNQMFPIFSPKTDPTELGIGALVMGQLKMTSPPPREGAPRFKIWTERLKDEKWGLHREIMRKLWGTHGIQCESPSNMSQS